LQGRSGEDFRYSQSASARSGFRLNSTQQSLPFDMKGWGHQAGMAALLEVLPRAHSGNIDVYVRFPT
jgi:hypothetical protein